VTDRTSKQNSSLHVMAREVAKQLNEAGYTQRTFWEAMKVGFDVPNSEASIKEVLQALSGSLNGEDRTHKLDTKEVQYLYEVFAHGMAQSCGIEVRWPEDTPEMIKEYEL
jgi:hypothetical protein